MSELCIQLLGGFNFQVNGTSITNLHQPRLQSLFAYLLLHRNTPQSRHHLAYTFWPDASESQARNNLRQLLYQLRHALPEAECFVFNDNNMVQWLSQSSSDFDVENFELVINAIATHDSSNLQNSYHLYCEAVSLYEGDLLPSCYDNWITPERMRLRQNYLNILSRLVKLLEDQRDYTSAILFAQKLLEHDPLNEECYLNLTRLHALNHNRAKALQVYYECVSTLHYELGIEPNQEVQAAFNHYLNLETKIISNTTEQARLFLPPEIYKTISSRL